MSRFDLAQAAYDAMLPPDTGEDERTECEVAGHNWRFDEVIWTNHPDIIEYDLFYCDECGEIERRNPRNPTL